MQEICLNIYNCIDKTGKIIINKILGIFNIQKRKVLMNKQN